MLKIQKTNDYSLFHFHPKNRPVHIKNLMTSVLRKDMLESHPILVCPLVKGHGYYIIDGQHRYEVCKQLGKPVYYIVGENIDADDIPQLQTQRPWQLDDYMKFYRNENEDYQFINKICTKYPYKVHFVTTCCSTMQSPYPSFRDGKYVITKDKKTLEKCFEMFDLCYVDCVKYTKKSLTHSGQRALWNLVSKPDFNVKQMLHKINTFPDLVVKAFAFKRVEAILTDLELLYDFANRKSRKSSK